MPNFSTPNFPIVTWQYDFTTSTNVVEVSGTDITGSPATINLTSKNLWGFDYDSIGAAGTCSSSSISGWLRDQINLLISSGANLVANWAWPSTLPANQGTPSTRWTRATGNNITLTFKRNGSASTELAAVFGFNGSSETITTFGKNTDWNSAAYWSPYPQYTCRDMRNIIAPVFISENSDGTIVEAVNWGAEKTDRILEYPTVYAADIWLYRRQNADFATPANRETGDPNNLLQNMFSAGRFGAAMRIWENTSYYRNAFMTDQDKLRSMEKSLDDISARGAMYEVSLLFRDLG